jgi:hypothetical protein
MDSKSKGEITEAIVLSELITRGLNVLTPLGENQRYDFVVESDCTFLRLQCKTGRDDGNTLIFGTRSTRPRATGCDREGYEGALFIRSTSAV